MHTSASNSRFLWVSSISWRVRRSSLLPKTDILWNTRIFSPRGWQKLFLLSLTQGALLGVLLNTVCVWQVCDVALYSHNINTTIGLVIGGSLEVILLPAFLSSFGVTRSPAHFTLLISALSLLVVYGILTAGHYFKFRDYWYTIIQFP